MDNYGPFETCRKVLVENIAVLIPNLLPPKSARATRVPSALVARFL